MWLDGYSSTNPARKFTGSPDVLEMYLGSPWTVSAVIPFRNTGEEFIFT
jgi:hypothetical protein